MSEYVFEPVKVAATIWRRRQACRSRGGLPHAFLEQSAPEGSRIAVRLGQDSKLFTLLLANGGATIESPYGRLDVSEHALHSAPPDPLWEAADEICAHMEADHADTFVTFLSRVGRSCAPEQSLSMPWVEERGFFLSLAGEPVFIPFPKACPKPSDVRASMILMLREARSRD